MICGALLLPLSLFSTGIFRNEVAALPSIRGLLFKDVLKTDQQTKPTVPLVNLSESHLKELSFKEFLDFLIEDVTDEQYLEALDLRYDKKYRHSFASVLKRSNSNDSTIDNGRRALQVDRFHRILFGVRCNVAADCESDEVCDEATIRGVTANFCYRAGPAENQQDGVSSEPLGDCASGDTRMACTAEATCEPTAIVTKDGPQVVNRCRCREEDGFVTKPGTFMHPDIENIIASGNLDFYGCVQVDECIGHNICPPADAGGICRDRDSGDGLYDCFCRRPNWIVAETDPIHGATKCQDLDECAVFGDVICPDNSLCENTMGGYTCTCSEGFLETSGGNCIAPEIVEEFTGCDPNFNNGDSCPESNRFCDPGLTRCLCIDGLVQPGGAGGSCVNVNECALGTDFRCDKPNAKCLDLTPTVEEPLGYSCECLPGFVDAPNEVRGTNCIPVEVEVVTPAPVALIAETPAPIAPVPPGPTPACDTSFANECEAITGEVLCVNGRGRVPPECTCDFRKFYTAVGQTSFINGDLACQLDECQENATICTASDPNSECIDDDTGFTCPCIDGFFLNSTSNLCENIPCSNDTDCILPTDFFPSTAQQRVCRQVLPTLMSSANTVNPLLNGCVCNVESGDWDIQKLQEIYCVRETCRIDNIVCPAMVPNRQTCVNAPGVPGYTCDCNFAFGEDTNGNCVDPCDFTFCAVDQVCQRIENSSPPRARCVDKNPCIGNPCNATFGGPLCAQNPFSVFSHICYCNVDNDCVGEPDTICHNGRCTDTCDFDPCASNDSGGLCTRDSLAPGGFLCHCDVDIDCNETASNLTVCTANLGSLDVCINPSSPCDGNPNPCKRNFQGNVCTPDNSISPPSFVCSFCTASADCVGAGEENTVCENSTGFCFNPCDSNPCVNDNRGNVCVPDHPATDGYFCSCTASADCAAAGQNTVCDDGTGSCLNPCDANPCVNDTKGELCVPDHSATDGYLCNCNDDDHCPMQALSKCNLKTKECFRACLGDGGVGTGDRCKRFSSEDGLHCEDIQSTAANPTPGYKCTCEDKNPQTNNDDLCLSGYTCDDNSDSAQDNINGTETPDEQLTGTNVCTPPP